MTTMGKYCKAYLAKQFRQFEQWHENAIEQQIEDGQSSQVFLQDDDVLYLQENYTVTYGIFQDEQIVFNQVTPEWQQFCQAVLKFEVPSFEAAK